MGECKVLHRQHDTVEDPEEMEPTAKIGAQSSADIEMEDNTQKHTKKSQPVLELTEDDDNPPPHPKKTTHQKQSKKKATVIDSDDSNDQVITKKSLIKQIWRPVFTQILKKSKTQKKILKRNLVSFK